MLEWTGERYLPYIDPAICGAEIHYEHLHRYAFASHYVKGKKVLDLASGEGYGTFILSKNADYVIGVEIDPVTVLHAVNTYGKKNIEFKEGSILNIPIAGEKLFDVIVCFEAMEHVKEHDTLFFEIKRLLKDDGILIISTPNKQTYTDDTGYHNPFHQKELYYAEFSDFLKKYFSYMYLFGQRIFSGSSISPTSVKASNSCSEFFIEQEKNHFTFTRDDEKISKYFIAIASNTELNLKKFQKSYLIDKSNTEIALLHSRVNQCNELIQSLEQAVIGKDRQLLDITTTVQSLEQAVIGKDRQLLEISVTVQSLEQEMAVKDQQLEEISTQVATLNHTLAVKNQQIQEISDQVTNLSQTLADKDQQIQEVFQKIIPVEKELLSIKNSIIWRTTVKYQIKVVDRLLKQETRRRKMYDLGLLSLHTIIDEGFRSFFWKQRQYRMQKTLFSISKGIEKLPVLSDVSDNDTIEPISKKVSIVIPTKNAGEDFSYTLEKIQYQKGIQNIEIIIVDSGSTDNTLSLAEKYGAKITKIAPEEFNHGETRNVGASKSEGEYLVFMVQDAIPIGEYWLYNMVRVLEGDEKIAAVSCRQVPRSDADLFACFCIWYHYSVTMNLHADISYSGNPTFKLLPIDDKRRRAGLEDVSCCIKKDIFNMYRFKRVQSSEDLDLGFRLMQDGYKTAFMFSNGVIHSHNRDPTYFFKRSYVDTKTVSGILGYTQQGIDSNCSLSEIVGTILIFNDVLNIAVRSMETTPLNISPHELISILKIHLLKYIYEGQRSNFDDITGPLDEVLEVINQTVPSITKIPQENQNIIFLNQYLSILDEFDKYLLIYPSLIEKNEEFFDSMFKLFALIAGASLAHYYLTESATQGLLDNYVISLDSLLCRGV